jgi:hypothetical protein
MPSLREGQHSVHSVLRRKALHAQGHAETKPFRAKHRLVKDTCRSRFDVLWLCGSGYNITFPFLGKEIKFMEADGPHLYHNVVHPDYPGLFFVGLVQPLGAIVPLCEVQSKWIAEMLEVIQFWTGKD